MESAGKVVENVCYYVTVRFNAIFIVLRSLNINGCVFVLRCGNNEVVY